MSATSPPLARTASPARVGEAAHGSERKGLCPRVASLIKGRLPEFGGHRTLLWAAPRLAAVFALAPLCVFALYTVRNSWWLLLVTSLLASAVVDDNTFRCLTVLGELARDNEDKAAQLGCAFQSLEITTNALRDDLERARVVQERMLPDLAAMPLPEQLDWAASFVPQEKVGGDYFDAAVIGPGRVAILFADVSGHGLSAALLTALMKSSFQCWVEEDWSLTGFVRLLNHRLFTLTPEQSYAAATLAIFDAASATLAYCNCGHNPEPYVTGPARSAPQRLDGARSLILGLLEGFTPSIATVQLDPGDTVVFATDGVTEATDAADEEYGVERLERLLSEHRAAPVSELVRLLEEAARSHVGEGALHDDMAVLALKVRTPT